MAAWDCAECTRRLDELVDRELSALELEEVEAHFSNCGDCVRRYEFSAELKRLLKRSCQETAPAELRERLRQLLKS
jgi:anti-sigma factor (TIGR02949 family)